MNIDWNTVSKSHLSEAQYSLKLCLKTSFNLKQLISHFDLPCPCNSSPRPHTYVFQRKPSKNIWNFSANHHLTTSIILVYILLSSPYKQVLGLTVFRLAAFSDRIYVYIWAMRLLDIDRNTSSESCLSGRRLNIVWNALSEGSLRGSIKTKILPQNSIKPKTIQQSLWSVLPRLL